MSGKMSLRMGAVALMIIPTLVWGQAADAVKVNRDVAYESDAIGSAIVRENCDWKPFMLNALSRYSRGRVVITDEDLKSVDGKTLVITVTSVHTAGGGGYSGSKWLNARAAVYQGDAIIASHLFARSTLHGAFTACGTLQKLGGNLGAYVGKWVYLDFKERAPRGTKGVPQVQPDTVPADTNEADAESDAIQDDGDETQPKQGSDKATT